MSSSNRGEKTSLSLRFQSLKNFYTNASSVWDIGCDHGLLGTSFVNESEVQEIHLVDPSEAVVETLKDCYKASYISSEKLFIHHQRGQETSLGPERKIVFIAGMGGKEIQDILVHLIPQLSSEDRVVISPHRKILELRNFLTTSELKLISEEVVFENNQYYQILGLSKGGKTSVSPFGDEIWKGAWGESYREHQVRHFSTHNDGHSKAYVSFLNTLSG